MDWPFRINGEVAPFKEAASASVIEIPERDSEEKVQKREEKI